MPGNMYRSSEDEIEADKVSLMRERLSEEIR